VKRIDLNCDMGESFGAYKLGMDEEVIRHISSANIACGFHAGDPLVMDKTVRLAKENNVAVGAHPGYPDLAGFGRRHMECTAEEIKDYIIYQTAALQGFCTYHGVRMQHVKPHGGLYNACVGNERLLKAVAEAVASIDKNLFLVVLGGTGADLAKRIAEAAGIRIAFEGFPDRLYTPEGRLAPRSLPGAVIKDPAKALEQALMMVLEGKVTASDGTLIPLQVETLCVHGDNPAALSLVKTLRAALEKEGVGVMPLGAP
jgi:UPF0271 protein